ncbi:MULTISPECIES: hypothetical protein [unclassified Bradyrhizobium]|uniref:hypothetical protein n=1 Tax=unclassified Bradyrhizobium TaxID=2631580 RepID=UPI002916955F|nr:MULTISPECIES: hypothetical protein [unclassified Bradyrhizobium]
MPKIRFAGRILPEAINLSVQDHPTISWKSGLSGTEGRFEISIVANAITVDCELHRFESQHFTEVYARASDLVSATINFHAFCTGVGFQAILEKVSIDGGAEQPVIPQDQALASLVSVVPTEQEVAQLHHIVLTDHALAQALRDLADGLRTFHTGPVVAQRAVETIRNYFVPPGADYSAGWQPMRDALNLSRDYLQVITDLSIGPRHGDRSHIPTPQLRVGVERAWVVMNRFLAYRLLGSTKLPERDFPPL